MKVQGWRKVGFAAAIVLGVFAFLFVKTPVGAEYAADIPPNVRDILIGVYLTFVGGNAVVHFAKAKNGG